MREPIVHFVIVAALLLGVQRWHEAWAPPVIEVDAVTLQNMARDFEKRRGRAPTRQEWQDTVDVLVEEELLFREAQKRGMVSDARVRGTLIEMMRAALAPVLPEPSDAELEAARQRLPESARTLPGQVAFDHVSFSAADRVPPDLLQRLRDGADPRGLGEPVRLANPLPATFRPQLERLMGAEFARRAFEEKTGEWFGPVASERGAHFLRITQRVPPRDIPIAELRPMLREEWTRARNREAVLEETRKWRERCRVVAPAPPEDLAR